MKQLLLTILSGFLCFSAFAQTGKIVGKIKESESGIGLIGASISVKGTNLGTIAATDGTFSLANVPAGTHVVVASFVGYTAATQTVTVKAGETSTVDFSLESSNILGDAVVVSASRRAEKLTEAPAEISVLTSKDFDRTASYNVGELASKLQGVEFVRIGVDGVGINARGFNNAFNAKILQMTDGRNSMIPGGSGLPLGGMNTVIKEDIDRVEVVLGPNSALYGPNAHNGVVNTITKDPRIYQGTTIVVDAGNQNLISTRLRHAMKLSNKFAFKLTGEYTKGTDFAFNDSVYVGNGSYYGAVRAVPERIKSFDFSHLRGEAALYYSLTKNTDFIASYGGSTNTGLAVNNVGRNQIDGWTYNYLQGRIVSPRIFAQVYYSWGGVGNSYSITSYTRDFVNRTNSTIPAAMPVLGPLVGKLTEAEAEVYAMRYGNKYKEDSKRLNGEIQYNNYLENIGLGVVASLSYQKDMPNTYGTSLIDSYVPGTEGTNLITVQQVGGALQLDKKLGAGFKLVASGRLDNHSVFGNMFSPKIALVKNVNNGSFRLTYGEAFAAPIILFQSASVIGYVFGNGNGISYIPNGANVNDPAAIKVTDKLVPEHIGTWEVGYKGTINKKLFLDINGYYGHSTNFLSPTITVGGRALKVGDISIPTQNLLLGGTANATTGILSGGAFATYFNYGVVNSWGIDFGTNYYFNDNVNLALKYSYFNSDITDNNTKNDANRDGYVSLEERSLNAPKNRIAATLGFSNLANKKLFINLSMRWVEQFDFYSGSQIATAAGAGKRGVVQTGVKTDGTPVYTLKNFDYGPLGGFTTFDISAGYLLTKNLSAGIAISNIFDTKQREFVGSPLIGRLFSAELKYHIPYHK